MSATTTSGGPTSIPITAGTYTPTSYCAHVQTQLNATRTPAEWVVTLSTGSSGTGLVTIDNPNTTWALTFTTAAIGTVMGFAGNIASGTVAVTGTTQHRGLWMPDCPSTVDGHIDMGAKETDARTTVGPWGATTTYKSTRLYAHTGLRYSHVPEHRIREAAAVASSSTLTHGSLEQWIDDTQISEGHAWFSAGSAFQAYWDSNGTDRLIGKDMNSGAGPVYGWTFVPCVAAINDHIKRVSGQWLGMWSVDLPPIVSRG